MKKTHTLKSEHNSLERLDGHAILVHVHRADSIVDLPATRKFGSDIKFVTNRLIQILQALKVGYKQLPLVGHLLSKEIVFWPCVKLAGGEVLHLGFDDVKKLGFPVKCDGVTPFYFNRSWKSLESYLKVNYGRC